MDSFICGYTDKWLVGLLLQAHILVESENFLFRRGGDEIFQVKRFEIGGVRKLLLVEQLFRQPDDVAGGGFYVFNETGIGRGDDVSDFVAAVSEEINLVFFQQSGKGMFIDDFGFRFGDRTVFPIEESGIDFHASGVEHRAIKGILVSLGGYRQRQGLQGGNGNQRFAGTETQSFRYGDTDAQSRVGAGAHADGDGIQLMCVQLLFTQHVIDEAPQQCGMVQSFVIFFYRDDCSGICQCDGTYGSGSVYV